MNLIKKTLVILAMGSSAFAAVPGTYVNNSGCTARLFENARFGITINLDQDGTPRMVDEISVKDQVADIQLCKDARLPTKVEVNEDKTQYKLSCAGSSAKVDFTFTLSAEGRLLSASSSREIFKGPLSNINDKQVITCDNLLPADGSNQ